MSHYGYARVSSRDQNLDRQIIALQDFGIQKRQIFFDKQTGRDFNRQGYRKMVRRLKDGDILVIGSIDRLGRNYEEILDQWRYLTKIKAIDVVVLDMPLLDTRRKGGDLTGKLIADLVLQILSYVAQTEREAIHKRQAEGIAVARERGVKFGRPKLPVPPEFNDCRTLYEEGKLTSRQAAAMLEVSQPTFLRWVNLFSEDKG